MRIVLQALRGVKRVLGSVESAPVSAHFSRFGGEGDGLCAFAKRVFDVDVVEHDGGDGGGDAQGGGVVEAAGGGGVRGVLEVHGVAGIGVCAVRWLIRG